MSKNYRYNTSFESDYWMESNGFYVGLNMPEALCGNENINETLPPYYRMKGMLVDEYPAAPSNWMRSEGSTASYFVGVKEGRGMWLDLNKNNERNHHVAVVISIQGVNPITGLPCEDPQLEQYIEMCPKCEKKFSANRHCKTCGYQWPKQNYLCTNATPSKNFWLDGFKTADGVVRQYLLTEEKMRGVANNITGGKQVYAIGLSFFLSKSEKPFHDHRTITRVGGGNSWLSPIVYGQPQFYGPIQTPIDWDLKTSCTTDSSSSTSSSTNISSSSSMSESYTSNSMRQRKDKRRSKARMRKALAETCVPDADNIITHHAFEMPDLSASCVETSAFHARTADYRKEITQSQLEQPRINDAREVITEKQLEVAAGAKIRQMVYDDPESLDFWRDKPEALICVNYCVEADANKILSNGRIPLDKAAEGFLQGIVVGNQGEYHVI